MRSEFLFGAAPYTGRSTTSQRLSAGDEVEGDEVQSEIEVWSFTFKSAFHFAPCSLISWGSLTDEFTICLLLSAFTCRSTCCICSH